MIKKVVLAVMVTIFIALLSSCHTVHGVGQDIESAGESIQKTAD